MPRPSPLARAAKPPPAKPPALPPKTPVETLIELGEELHGAHWIGPTSRDLDVAHRTVANWVSGKSRLPDGRVLEELRLLVESHRKAVAQVRKLANIERKISNA